MASACHARPVQRAILGLLTIVSYGSWFYGFSVLLPDIAESFGSGVGIPTVGYALAQVLTGILGVVAGRMLDRRGATTAFVLGAAVGPTAVLASSLATNVWFFAIMFGLGGGAIGATGFYQLTQAITARLAPGNEARAIARLTIWGAFASPVMIPLTEISRTVFGWRWTIRLGAIAVLIVLILAALLVDRHAQTRSSSPSMHPLVAVRIALEQPDVRRLALSSLAGSFGASAMIVLQVPAMIAGGLDQSLAATMAGSRGAAQLLGRLPLTQVLTRISSRQALRGAKVLLAVGTLALIFSGNLWMAMVFVIVAGASLGALSPLDGIYAREVLPPADLGTLMAALFLLSGVAAGIGPLVAGVLIDVTGSINTGLIAAAIMLLLGAAILRPSVAASAGRSSTTATPSG